MIARKAENSPIWKNISTGIRKTKSGIVCNMSQMGRMIAQAMFDTAERRPSRPPSTAQAMTAAPQR